MQENPDSTLPEKLEQFERAEMKRALLATNCNITATAEMLGVERWRIYRKMRRFGWSPRDRVALYRQLTAQDQPGAR